MTDSHFEQEAEHQKFSISEKEDFTAAKLYDCSFSEAVSSVLKGIKSQIPADLELRPDGTILLGTVPVDTNTVAGQGSAVVEGVGSALKNAIESKPSGTIGVLGATIGEIGAATAAGGIGATIGDALKTPRPEDANPVTGTLLQQLLQQAGQGGISGALKPALPRQMQK